MEREDDDLFTEEQNGGLTLASQGIVCQHIFDFIKQEYTINAKAETVMEVCKAAIVLFASLKANGSEIGGIVREFLHLCLNIFGNVLTTIFYFLIGFTVQFGRTKRCHLSKNTECQNEGKS